MEPKEKAKELYNKFYSEFIQFDKGCNLRGRKKYALKCSLLCVDEILQTNPTLKGTSDDLITMIVQTKAYWYRVQEEINML